MKIHREGFAIISAVLLGLFLINWLAAYFLLAQYPFVFYLILFAGLILLFFVLQFFRNPARKITVNPQHILAPADGKVVVIEETVETEYFKENRRQISIFMSPLNVHINRNPASGKINYFKYHSGKYLVAWHPKSSSENERTTLVLKTESGIEILLRQIAGAVARRIRCYVKEGHTVKQGEEFGFIKFGSRVDIFLPLNVQIKVKIGDKTKAGESILAVFDKM